MNVNHILVVFMEHVKHHGNAYVKKAGVDSSVIKISTTVPIINHVKMVALVLILVKDYTRANVHQDLQDQNVKLK